MYLLTHFYLPSFYDGRIVLSSYLRTTLLTPVPLFILEIIHVKWERAFLCSPEHSLSYTPIPCATDILTSVF